MGGLINRKKLGFQRCKVNSSNLTPQKLNIKRKREKKTFIKIRFNLTIKNSKYEFKIFFWDIANYLTAMAVSNDPAAI